MATQMVALDEFVTRARSQNDVHHTERLQTFGRIVSRARGGYGTLQTDRQESRRTFETFVEDQQQERSELEALVGSLEAETRTPLSELSHELSDSTLAEYAPTGKTPRKRDWHYPTDLPRTENHDAIIAKLRGLPEPILVNKAPISARTPGKSPRKQASPRKAPGSPSKIPSPSKTKVFTDVEIPRVQQLPIVSQTSIVTTTTTIPLIEAKTGGLKEIDINVANSNKPLSASSTISSYGEEKPVLLDFSKSVGSGHQQPPLKRHATANAVVESRLPATKLGRPTRKTFAGGVENFSQSVGPMGAGRRLRSSPPE